MNAFGKAALYTTAALLVTQGLVACGGGGTDVSRPTKDPYALGQEYSDLVAAEGDAVKLDAATAKIKTTLGLSVNTPTLFTDIEVQAAGPGKKFFAVYKDSNELFYISKDAATGKKQDTLIFSMTPDQDSKHHLTFVSLRTTIAGQHYRLDNSNESGNLQNSGIRIANEYGVQSKNETKPAPEVTPDNFRAIEVGAAVMAHDYAKLSSLLDLPTTIAPRAVDQIHTAPAGSKFFATDGNGEVFYVSVETANDGRVRHIVDMTFGPFSETRPDWALKSAGLFAQVRNYGGQNFRSDDAGLNTKVDAIGTTFDVQVTKATESVPGLTQGDPDGIALGDAYEAKNFTEMSNILGFPAATKVLTNLAAIEQQGDGVYWAYNPSAPGEVFFVIVSQGGRQFDEVRVSFGHDEASNLIPTELHGQAFNKSGSGLEPLVNSAANGNLATKAAAAADKVGADFTNQSLLTAALRFNQKFAVQDRLPLAM